MSARAPRLRGARGAANALIIVAMTGVMLLAAGLAFDGSRVLAARREAVDVARQAARAGAQAIDAGAVRAGRVAVDPAQAVAAAEAFLRSTGHRGDVTAAGRDVIVTVSIGVPLPLLSAAGVPSTTVTGRGSAHLVRGITEAEG
jgi:Flp pilus assembly protein TadG